MKPYEQLFYRRSRNPFVIVGRDLRLLGYLAKMAWMWLWRGGKIRRLYRAKEAAGEKFWVDQ